MNDERAREFRKRGVLKIDYRELVGPTAFDALSAALADAEAKAKSGEASTHDEGYAGNVFFRLGSLLDRYPEVEAAVRAPRVGALAASLAGVDEMRRWS